MAVKKGIYNLFYPKGEEYSSWQGEQRANDPTRVKFPIGFDVIAEWECNVKKALVTYTNEFFPDTDYPYYFSRTETIFRTNVKNTDLRPAIDEAGITLRATDKERDITFPYPENRNWIYPTDSRWANENYEYISSQEIVDYFYYNGTFYYDKPLDEEDDPGYVTISKYTRVFTKQIASFEQKNFFSDGSLYSRYLVKFEPLETYF